MNEYKYLTFEERMQIEKWYAAGERHAEIASRLHTCVATVYRELKRGYTGSEDKNFRPGYSAELAERSMQDSFKRRGRKKAERQEAGV